MINDAYKMVESNFMFIILFHARLKVGNKHSKLQKILYGPNNELYIYIYIYMPEVLWINGIYSYKPLSFHIV
jgi:hypothetical protein